MLDRSSKHLTILVLWAWIALSQAQQYGTPPPVDGSSACQLIVGSYPPKDIIFLLDGSSSIKIGNFTQQALPFVHGTVARLSVGQNASRIGVVQFNANQKTEFSLNAYFSKDELFNVIDNVLYRMGVTYTGAAIRNTIDREFSVNQGDRVNVPNVLVVLTDGYAQDNVKQAAQYAQHKDVEVFAVGVTTSADAEQLLEIANGRQDHVLFISDGIKLAHAVEQVSGQLGGDRYVCPNVTSTANPFSSTPTTPDSAIKTSESQQLNSTTESTAITLNITGGSGWPSEGEVRVDCDIRNIKISLGTKQPFKGIAYIKGHFSDEDCRLDHSENDDPVAMLQLLYGTCGMQRERSSRPAGVIMSATIVFMFHPMFLTKGDKAYRVQCFFMEGDKTVTRQLDIDSLTTVGSITKNFDMPSCQYVLRVDSPNGPLAKYVNVGHVIYHRWSCERADGDTMAGVYGMKVHTCYASDGDKNRVLVIGQDGCPSDPRLIPSPLTYSDSLLTAFAPIETFKFADAQQLLFECQISLCLKVTGQCDTITPPRCGAGKVKRHTVEGKAESETSHVALPVTSNDVIVLETLFETDSFTYTSPTNNTDAFAVVPDPSQKCISHPALIAAVVCPTFVLVASATILSLEYRKRSIITHK